MSYTSTTLRTAIKEFTDYTETSFVSNLNLFITNAEQRIFSEADLEFFTKVANGALTSTNPVVAVPSDYIASNSFAITTASNERFLQQKEANYVRSIGRDSSNGVPRFYARVDVNDFVVAPTPDANYTFQLSYYYRPDSLTVSTVTMTMTSVSGTFQADETLTGGTSGTTTTVKTRVDGPNITIIVPIDDFTVGETVTGGTSGATGVVASITTDSTKTWLSDNYPNALFYASMVEAYIYMKGEPDLISTYEGRFQQQLARLKELGTAREQSDAYRRGRPDRMRG